MGSPRPPSFRVSDGLTEIDSATAREIWTRLHDDNRRVASLLGRLGDLARDDPDGYSASLEGFATAHSNTPGEAQCSQVLQDLKAAMTVSSYLDVARFELQIDV